MELSLFLIGSQIAAGLARGGMYFLLAMGLTLIFGVLRIINFAHGAFFMLAVFLCVTIARVLGFWLALIIVPVVLALVGGIVEIFILRRVYKAEHLIQLLATFALVYIITDLVKAFWERFLCPFPPFFHAVQFSDLRYKPFQFITYALMVWSSFFLSAFGYFFAKPNSGRPLEHVQLILKWQGPWELMSIDYFLLSLWLGVG